MFDSSLEYIRPFLLKNPSALMQREKEHVEPLIAWLTEMNFGMDEIRELLLVRKGYIRMKVNEVKRIYNLLKSEFNFSDDELKLFIVVHGNMLAYVTYKRLKENIQILQDETRTQNEVLKAMILKNIGTIICGSLREKLNYLRTDMRFTNEQIIQNLRKLDCSFPRLKSRHQFLLLHGKNIPGLSRMLKPQDKIFVEKYFPDLLLQEFELFKKKYYKQKD